MCAQRSNLTTIFNCKAQELVVGDDGKVTGVICENNGTVTQFDAPAVIVCTGGFLERRHD